MIGFTAGFVSELMASLILKSVPGVRVEDVTVSDAPEANETSVRILRASVGRFGGNPHVAVEKP